MKRTKRIFAIFMTLALAMSMLIVSSAVSFAEGETYKITIQPNATNDTHTYEAYQIIKGDLDTTEGSATKGQLKNLEWATGVNGQNLLSALKADATIGSKFTNCDSTVASVADAMGKCTTPAEVEALAKVIGAYAQSANLTAAGTSKKDGDNQVITGLSQGYYFVKDTTGTTTLDTLSRFMLQVVGDVTVTAKDSTVSMDKKVDDKNDSTTGEDAINWQDTADYDVNDTIPYRLKGTLPADYDKFDFFDYKFTDKMSDGLTLDADSVKVVYYANAAAFAADTTAAGGTDITDKFTISPKADTAGAELTVSIASTFSEQGGAVQTKGLKEIEGLTKDSVIVVYYKAVLNENAVIGSAGNPNTAKLEFSNNPNATGQGDNTKGETPEDKNIVFTYKLSVDKVDEKNKPLPGATFALYKKVADSKVSGATKGSDIKTALGDAVESSALVNDSYYIEVGRIEASEVKTDGETTSYTANFNRIDDGDYVLVEAVVPAGYNSWASKAFTVTATHSNDPAELKLTSLTGGELVTGDFKDTGIIATEIQNNSGATLPSTGGIGTIIFYVLGSLLVVGCGIVLISKRRMESR